MPIGLYIHIPFCETKCSYCDFNTYAGIENLLTQYIDSICKEIKLWGSVIPNANISTIFFGGGTPSYIPANLLAQILLQNRIFWHPSSRITCRLPCAPTTGANFRVHTDFPRPGAGILPQAIEIRPKSAQGTIFSSF